MIGGIDIGKGRIRTSQLVLLRSPYFSKPKKKSTVLTAHTIVITGSKQVAEKKEKKPFKRSNKFFQDNECSQELINASRNKLDLSNKYQSQNGFLSNSKAKIHRHLYYMGKKLSLKPKSRSTLRIKQDCSQERQEKDDWVWKQMLEKEVFKIEDDFDC